MRTAFVVCALLSCTGCATIIEPGHRALEFSGNGLKPEVLNPGRYYGGLLGTGVFRTARLDDFDVTYSTRKEEIQTTSAEGLGLGLKLAVIFRPIVSELYQLDTEIGPNYYDEVVGPEFRSTARGVFARHSYMDLQKQNEKIEDEIEVELRRRTSGKHIEITSVTLESIAYAPEIAHAVQAKLVGEQEAARQKAALENEALRRKLELEHQAEQDKLKADAAMREKQNERAIAEEQSTIDEVQARTEAVTRVTRAKAQAEEATLMAKAHAEEKRAEAVALTPLAVQMHAYDALGKLGGSGTSVLLGDWSHAPSFLFPFVQGALPIPPNRSTVARKPPAPTSDNPYGELQ